MIGGQYYWREAAALRERLLHAVKHDALLIAQRVPVDALVGDDRELRRVDRVGALTQNLSLRPFLPSAKQKLPHVLKIRFFFRVIRAENLRSAERRAVAGEHVGDFALADRDKIRCVDAKHEGKEGMQPAPQHFRL